MIGFVCVFCTTHWDLAGFFVYGFSFGFDVLITSLSFFFFLCSMFSGIEFDFAYFTRVIKTKSSFKRFTRQSWRERTFCCLVRFMVSFTYGNYKPLLISSGKDKQKMFVVVYRIKDMIMINSPSDIEYQQMELLTGLPARECRDSIIGRRRH